MGYGGSASAGPGSASTAVTPFAPPSIAARSHKLMVCEQVCGIVRGSTHRARFSRLRRALDEDQNRQF